ncbi:MAG: hypothetical protein R3Y68_09365 [Rikenellaceae bacterium]
MNPKQTKYSDPLMDVSLYDRVIITERDLPVKIDGESIDLDVKSGEDISEKLQSTIDKYSAAAGAIINIPAGEYTLGGIIMRSNCHLLFDKDVVINVAYDGKSRSASVFNVGNPKGGSDKPLVRNISIVGVGGRFKVIVPKALNGFDNKKFVFISSVCVENFYYANFDIYSNKTTGPTLSFGTARKNDNEFYGPTRGLVMNSTLVGGHYGYGLVQTQAGTDIRFYNLHGIGGITLRLETGDTRANEEQFGGVRDIVGENISIANGHGGVMCGPHGLKNGVCHFRDITSISSATAFSVDESKVINKDKKSSGHRGSFSAGTSVYNVTSIFGYNAQIKTKEFRFLPMEFLEMDRSGERVCFNEGVLGRGAVLEDAPAHTCVRIATSVPIEYDIDTFHAIGYEFDKGEQIRITDKNELTEQGTERQHIYMDYYKKKFPAINVTPKEL